MTRLLITGARAPAALHLARLFKTAGHHVIMADSQAHPIARSSRFIDDYVILPKAVSDHRQYGRSVAQLVAERQIDLVIPTCEEIFFLAAARDLHGEAIPLLAPHVQHLAAVHNKFSFTQLATGFGADPPETMLLTSSADLGPMIERAEHLVFKPVWSRFGDRVLIRPSRRQLEALNPSPSDPWVAQNFLPGEELCCWALANEGVVLACQAYKPLYRAGQGAGLAFASVQNPVISAFVCGLAQSLGWTGQISFDFRRDSEGRLHVTECNPRSTSGLHFFGVSDGLPAAFLASQLAQASMSQPMTLKLAMLAYGIPDAIKTRSLGSFWRDFQSFGDIIAFAGERGLGVAQLRSLLEISTMAIRSGKSLKAAATDDIEWNGQPL